MKGRPLATVHLRPCLPKAESATPLSNLASPLGGRGGSQWELLPPGQRAEALKQVFLSPGVSRKEDLTEDDLAFHGHSFCSN